MLDWLKEILGESWTDEIDKKVSDEIGKGFVSRSDFNTKNEELKTAKATLKERDGLIFPIANQKKTPYNTPKNKGKEGSPCPIRSLCRSSQECAARSTPSSASPGKAAW